MKPLIALVLSLWVGAAQAQMTLAYQFKQGNGFEWKNGQWQEAAFYAGKPFFLLIQKDQKIDPKSALVATGTPPEIAEAVQMDMVCFPHRRRVIAQFSSCSGPHGESIIVSLETFEGAVSKLLGSVTDKIFNRDSLYVMPFICQKM